MVVEDFWGGGKTYMGNARLKSFFSFGRLPLSKPFAMQIQTLVPRHHGFECELSCHTWKLGKHQVSIYEICVWHPQSNFLTISFFSTIIIHIQTTTRYGYNLLVILTIPLSMGGQREERKIEAHPVSCLSWRLSPYTNHQPANNNGRATILFTVE